MDFYKLNSFPSNMSALVLCNPLRSFFRLLGP